MVEFRDMRRKRQQLSEEGSIEILQKATAGTLALLGDNGYPYAVPISYVYTDGRWKAILPQRVKRPQGGCYPSVRQGIFLCH